MIKAFITGSISRLVLIWMAALLIALPILAIGLASTPPVRAEGPGGFVSNVVPFLGILSGMRSRNRIYREARELTRERQAYYDKLREKAREQLINREIGGLRDSQVAAYIKLVAMVEQERQVTIDFAESQKRAARQEFQERVENAIVKQILATSGVQRVFGAIRQGINSSQGVIETALGHLGEGGEIFTEVEKVRRIAGDINFAAGIIGGRTGAGIRRTTSRIINTLDTATADIQSGLEQTQGDLSELDQNVSAFSETGRSPNVSQTTSEVTIASVVSGDDKPVIEAVIKLLAGKTRQDRTTMKDLARAKILGGFVARCAFIGTQYRKAITRLQGDQSPGLTDEEATAPCLAIDLEELERQVVEGQQSAPDTGAEPTGEPAGEAAAEPTETPPSATVTLTWGEQTDLDLAVGLTRDISWDSTPDGTELGDDVVCPTSGGTEQVVVEGPGIYHISVGLWSGCIINEQHLPHFASYTIKVEYSDGRQEEYSGAIEGQIWMFVAEIELK